LLFPVAQLGWERHIEHQIRDFISDTGHVLK